MSGRAPLVPVPGLARTASLPPPPPRRSVTPKDATVAEPSPVVEEPAAVPEARSRASDPSPVVEEPAAVPEARSRASDAAEIMRSVTLSLPVGVVRQVKDRARADRISQPEVVMDALLAVRDEIGELLAKESRPVVSDGLFVRRAGPRGNGDPLATLSLRMLSRNVAAIDELAQVHQAPSRSALCLVALRAYLSIDS